MKMVVTFASLLFSSCISTDTPSELSDVLVGGPYAKQWTIEDSRQIRQLIREHPEIKKPLYGVDAFARDRAHILIGSEWRDVNSIGATFDVKKRNGRWFIVKGSRTPLRGIPGPNHALEPTADRRNAQIFRT